MLHLHHAHRGHIEHLGLSTLEETRTVGTPYDSNLSLEFTEIRKAATVETDAFAEDTITHHLLGDFGEGFLDHVAFGIVFRTIGLNDLITSCRLSQPTFLFTRDCDDLSQLGLGEFGNLGVQLIGVFAGNRPLFWVRAEVASKFDLKIDKAADVFLGLFEPTSHCGLVRGLLAIVDHSNAVFGGTSLNHNDVNDAVVVANASHG